MQASSAHNLASYLLRSARCWPRRPALALGEAPIADYATLATTVAALAASLRDAGLVPGDRVALVSRNTPDYIGALYACWWAGLVAVPVNAKLHPRELAFVLTDCGARWAFVDEAWHSALASIAPSTPALEEAIVLGGSAHRRLAKPVEASSSPYPVEPDSPAWLFYTSGTTGRPKGVVLSHRNLLAMTQCFLCDVEPVLAGDAILHPAPLSHGSGLYAPAHIANGAVNVVPESGGFDAAELRALLHRWDRALLFAAPTMVKRIVASGLDGRALERLKCIVYGGGPMYVADCREAYAALGPRLAQIYGQGESPMTITAMNRALLAQAIADADEARIASVGVAQTGIEIRVGGAHDDALSPGELGEVLVRGATVMQGYWNNPEASAKTLANGWLHTGDVGFFDEAGFLTLRDRSKDLIISGGANIYPREVEEVLQRHPGVREVAVIGRRHAEWGEEVVACVVPRTPLEGEASRSALEASLDALCLSHIARFKRPRAYLFVDELPKNNAGKVLKTALRERFA